MNLEKLSQLPTDQIRSDGARQNPSDFLKKITGQNVVVKLNNGSDYRGVLKCLDGYMNIVLKQTEEYINGEFKRKYGDAFIRDDETYYLPRPRLVNKLPRGQQVAAIPIQILLIINSSVVEARYSSNYDPEQQDGIPILSARSLRPRPADDWLNQDEENDKTRQAESLNARLMAQRRQSDGDLDDGLEDEEDDEYQSGSSNHEQIEPSYGESRRSAKDGDDIENFFDRHLGPPEDSDSRPEASSDTPSYAELPAGITDPHPAEDMYKAAASGPLATIFQSLFGSNRKPLIIHATTEQEPSTTATSSSSSATNAGDSDGKDSSKIVVGQASSPKNTGGSMLRAAGQLVESVAPLAYLMPLAEPASSASYDSQAAASPSANTGEGTAEDDRQQIQEIYIGRRPHIASLLRQQQQQQQTFDSANSQQPYASSDGLSSAAGSAQVWRNSPMSARQVVAGGNYRQHYPATNQYDDQSSTGGDYARYPIAASYAYQREQPSAPSAADDEQTVTYGLSLGQPSDQADEVSPNSEAVASADEQSGGGESSDDSQPMGYNGAEQQQQQQPAQQGYVPYSPRDLMRYRAASTQAYNNFPSNGAQYNPMMQQQRQQAALNALMQRRYRQQQLAQQLQQQQQPYHGSRYHRDPSETTTLNSYGPGSHRRQYADNNHKATTVKRQQLLADLDKQIRASSLYGRNPLALRPDKQMTSQSTIRSGFLNSDLDTYDSYHSEMDPYKTFTRSSKMIRYPAALMGNKSKNQQPAQLSPIEMGSDRGVPANADTNISLQQSSQASSASQTDNQQQQQPQAETNGNLNNLLVVNQTKPGDSSAPLATGPMINYDSSAQDLLRNYNRNAETTNSNDNNGSTQTNLRVRRDDSDDRESDDADDDGVWVDDDDDDDNKQQSSDVNETSQEPEEDGDDADQEQHDTTNGNQLAHLQPPGVVGGPHGYELSPNDLMVYHG